MASGSPRDRINKFFASKRKQKSSSPFKLSRNEKDEKATVGGSPSAMGNLDGYLKRREDGDHVVRHSYSDNSSSEGIDSARRNLVADMEKHARSEYTDNEPSLWAGLQQCDSSEATPKKMDHSSSGLNNVTAEGETKDYPLLTNQTENVELRQFANNFLSLYCSELQSTVQLDTKCSGNKRQGSPSFMNNKCQKSTKRLHLSMEQKDDHNLLSNGDNAVETVTTLVLDVTKGDFNISSEIDVSNTPAKLESSLRKCNLTHLSTVDLTACHTPASLVIKSNASKTPSSTCGSSIFSPGEAFWSEAVKLADGFCNPTHSRGLKTITDRGHPGPLQKLLTSSQKNSEIAAPGPSESRTHLTGTRNLDSAVNIEDTVPKLSPLPVKRFDFTSDGKILDVDYVHKERNLHQMESKAVFNDQNDDTDDPGLILHGGNTILAKPEMDEACTPSSRLSCKDQLELTHWLPSEICNIYRTKGIVKLYQWQVRRIQIRKYSNEIVVDAGLSSFEALMILVDCLLVEGVLERRNLVYCASTSAGKSFVAEILLLRRLLSTGKIAMLVLPFVSICTEKAEHLEALLEPLGKHVRNYYGNQGSGILPKDTSVAVCTIEKANSLLNRLVEEGRLSEVGIIVIDELHMVGDPHRGYLLELMLTKLRYAAGEGNPGSISGESSNSSSGKGDFVHGLQIVGMSATMPNVAAVAEWLQAALYQTDFRPVPLEEYIKVGNSIYSKSMEIVRTISKAADLGGKDPDHIVELCDETVQDGHSVLIFCSSRKGCESTARHVAKFLMKFSAVSKRSDDDFPDTTYALDALRRSPAGLDPILEETLPCGVAYHHAGLTVEEREVIETCYRKGLVRVLTATSTLAAGVNLPARRVIFRQPRVGRDFIDGTRYKQMAGRAGRTGIDTKGESILICKPEEVRRITGLLNEKCPLLDSCLSEDKNGMTHAILEVVAGGVVQSAYDINRYVRCTMLSSTKPFEAVVKSAQDSLRWLCQRKFLEWSEETKLYGTTPLGRAAFGSSLTPEESLTVLEDLSRAREGFVLASDLHLVYIVTPTNIDIEPDWELYYQRFMELSGLDQSVANRVGIVEPFLMRMAHCAPTHSTERSKGKAISNRGKGEKLSTVASNVVLQKEQALRVCKRFYVALILSRLVEEVPVAEVCEAYKVARGMVQALQENAGRFASMVSMFCERLGWHDMEGLVCKFQNRVSFGVRAEIVELTSIPYIKGSRARALYKAGLRTPLAIAEASVPEIVKALFDCSSYANEESSAQRRLQVGIAKKIKNGARKIVLDKAEEARVAAFSAFQSLGFDVTHFSRPMLTAVDEHAKQGLTGTYLGDGTSGTVSAPRNASAEEAIVESKGYDRIMESGDAILKSNPISHSVATAAVCTSFLQSQVEASCHPASLTGQPTTKASSTAPASGKEADMICFSKPEASVNGDRINDDIDCSEKLGQNGNQHLHFLCRDPGFDKGPIGVVTMPGGLDYFLDIWDSTSEFYFEIHYNKRKEANGIVPFEMHGIAICWDCSPVYYVNFSKDLLKTAKKNISCLNYGASSDDREKTLSDSWLDMVHSRWNRISDIMGKKNVRKFTWNFKVQIQVLKNAAISIHRVGLPGVARKDLGFQLIDNSFLVLPSIELKSVIDMSVVAWILWPDEERSSNPNIDKEVKRRLSVEAAAAAHRCGRWRNQMKRPEHDGCCRRVAQSRALRAVLWKLVIYEGLLDPLDTIEIPLVNVLADMELWGVGVDMEGCLRARNLLGKKLRHLEKEAYSLAGISFSLYTAADIANVLYGHLKLPIPEASSKGKRHPSTDKQCLDLLRHEHPIIPIIKEHRTLAKLLNCTLGPICSLAKLSKASQKYMVHGHWLQTSTSTGRLSMEEPNLQCVEHSVEFEFNKDDDVIGDVSIHHNINARDFIVPTQEDCLFLAADYSQIELRLMAHFSRDASLIELLSQPHGDVFTMIAARWTGKAEETVSSNERELTKRMVYGILYGMGSKSLAEQLDCRPVEATEKIQNFKATFPGVASWLHEAVCLCRQKGYVETLNGRKRFFSKIKFGNDREKLKAQRQAVNSICQGSAADIIKIAMINIHAIIVGGVNCKYDSTCQLASKFHILKGKCRIILQVHDELVLEVDPLVVKDAAILLKESMENAVSLLVPLRVKLKVGRSWGSLEDFHAENYVNTV